MKKMSLFIVLAFVSLAEAQQSCRSLFDTPKTKSLGLTPLETDLFQLQDGETYAKEPTEIQKMNERALTVFARDQVGPNASSRKAALDPVEIQTIFSSIYDNPAANPNNIAVYDQPHTKIGYCFGRATFYHLQLLRNGVEKSSIRKAWMVGPMTAGSVAWHFHVATIVRANDGLWYALDPNFSAPVELSKWYSIHYAKSPSGTVRLYLTEGKKFTPTASYDNVQMGLKMDREKDWYRNYFVDMFKASINDQKRKDAVPVITEAQANWFVRTVRSLFN